MATENTGVSSTAPVEPRVPQLTQLSMASVQKFLEERLKYQRELEDWNRGRVGLAKVPELSVKAMINPHILTTLERFKIDLGENEVLTDKKILDYFEVMKSEHVSTSRPDLGQVLAKVSLDPSIADPVGRCLTFFCAIEEKLEHSCLSFLWSSEEDLKTLLKEVVRRLPEKLRKKVNQEARLNAGLWKSSKACFDCIEKYVIELNGESLDGVSSRDKFNRNGKRGRSPLKDNGRDAKKPRADSGSGKPAAPAKCFKCGDSKHKVAECPKASPEEKKLKVSHWIQKIKASSSYPVVRLFALRQEQSQNGIELFCDLDFASSVLTVDPIRYRCILDSGADSCVAPMDLLTKIDRSQLRMFEQTTVLDLVGGEQIYSRVSVYVPRLIIHGRLLVRDVLIYLVDNLNEVLVGRDILKRLGLDPNDNLLAKLRAVTGGCVQDSSECLGIDEEKSVWHTTATTPNSEILSDLIRRICARLNSDGGNWSHSFRTLLEEFGDIFRVGIDASPPMICEPYRPQLIEGAKPVRACPRRYTEEQREFLRKTVQTYVECGLLYRNQSSRWSSPVFLTPKGSSWRFTVDLRRVNQLIVPRAWPQPFLEQSVERVARYKYYCKLDADNGYWQIPLSADCQEMFSILVDDQIYTPTRLLQGVVDGVSMFQSSMSLILEEFLHKCVEIWIDDIVVFANSIEELIANLKGIFLAFRKYRVKLNPNKTHLVETTIEWCGRVISNGKISPNPEYVQALTDMRPPEDAAALQQYLTSCNWIRKHFVDFTGLFKALQELLLAKSREVGSLDSKKLRKLPVTLDESQMDCFLRTKEALKNIVHLAVPRAGHVMCLMTDASDTAWSIVLTQFPKDQMHLPVEERDHEPLCFMSGLFKANERNWSVCEKECYPIWIALVRLEHYLRSSELPFMIMTDHRNLSYIFSHSGSSKPTTERLERWLIVFLSYFYLIEHIDGIKNVFPDLLSRWGAPLKMVKIASLKIDGHFASVDTIVWPSLDEIREAQFAASEESKSPYNWDEEMRMYVDNENHIWIPSEDLAIRIITLGHCGSSGHRGIDSTLAKIQEKFVWSELQDDVENFLKSCYHCLVSLTGRIPRPLGSAVHGTKPNEVIHIDFATVFDFDILVMKDDVSQYVRLRLCEDVSAASATIPVLDWIADFGLPKCLVSDRGSHFKNQLMSRITEGLKIDHHMTLPYTPWSNGSVERVVRELKKVLIRIQSELRLKRKDIPQVLPLVQFALNMSIRPLTNLAPITVMTGLPPSNALDSMFFPLWNTTIAKASSRLSVEKIQEMTLELQRSLDKMHKEVVDLYETNRIRKRDYHVHHQKAQFHLGDFVLVAKVTNLVRNKMELKWTGPWKIVDVISEWIFEVEHLLNGQKKLCHSQRLRFFSEELNNVEEIADYVVNTEESYAIEKLLAIKFKNGGYVIKVRWLGFDQFEDSWLTLEELMEQVPLMVEEFLRNHRHGDKIRESLR